MALVLVAALLLGMAVGRLMFPVTERAADPVVLEESVGAPDSRPASGGVVPDVEGLALDEARASWVDAGIDATEIEVQEIPFVGTRGLVVGQDPAAGAVLTSAGPGASVVLTVSRPGRMPDLIGRMVDQSQLLLDDVGVSAQVEEVFRAGARVGEVLDSEPASGEPLSVETALTVASAGHSVYLADLDASDVGRCEVDRRVRIEETLLQHSAVCAPTRGEDEGLRYRIDGLAVLMEFTVGLTGRASAGTVTVLGDGDVLETLELSQGPPSVVQIPVAGVQALSIISSTQDRSSKVVMGELRVVGAPSDIDTLERRRG